MSLLIKGMEMPKNCEVCPMCHSNAEYDYAYCCVSSAETTGTRRPTDCPLIDLPDHGDLIDRDALKDKAEFIGDAFSGRGGFAVWGIDVINAPVFIPAERREDGVN